MPNKLLKIYERFYPVFDVFFSVISVILSTFVHNFCQLVQTLSIRAHP